MKFKRQCVTCKKEFETNANNSFHCGSRKQKTGCAYLSLRKWYASNDSHKEKDKLKKRELRKNKEYREKCNLGSKKWRNNNKQRVRKSIDEWRHRTGYCAPLEYRDCIACGKRFKQSNYKQIYCGSKNKKKGCSYNAKLLRNLDRLLLQKNTKGTHTMEEWLWLCSIFNNKCAHCGVDGKLTKDHIVPITKKGTNDIFNIQPLCKSCNSKKHNSLEKETKVVFLAAVCDMTHHGHFNVFKKMRATGKKTIVILHDDASVFRIKGKIPIQNLAQRIENVKITEDIDEILSTYSEDPAKEFEYIIRRYGSENVEYFRGDDKTDEYPGKHMLDKHGIKINYLPYTKGVSSSQIREEICR